MDSSIPMMINSDMLIELPDSLIIPDSSPEESAEVLQLVNDLMSHVLRKDHEVHFGYNFLEWILPKFTHLVKIRSALEFYRDNWYTNPIPDFITEYIRIIPLSEAEGQEIVNNKTIQKVHYTRLLQGEPFSPSKLVCENNNDHRFYSYIANWWQKQLTANFQLSISSFPGGGVTTCDNFRNSVARNHFSLCIVDSDKRHPNCKKVGDTAQECRRVKATTSLPYHKLYILSCMEAENLIPMDVIANIQYDGDVELRRDELVAKFRNCTQQTLNEIYPFYDLKGGFKKNPNFLTKRKWREYVERCFTVVYPTENYQSTLATVMENEIIIMGIKGDLLDKSITLMENVPYDTWDNQNLMPFQLLEWSNIGSSIINFGFAAPLESNNY